ncbi:threonylcarbamoyl-AMP synthase [Ruminococcaceae bacterium OttesenSCG-928-A16]|nr:threonylcarbamoyl-AMP synthase [Ruminococcaceae bacterium OttesenSCG-928-A16]
MDTGLLAVNPGSVAKAAALLRRGQVVAIPTETVYGLAANALDEKAVERIFTAKGRPQDNPLIVHIDSMEMLPMAARKIPKEALLLAKAFWPGPLTMVLPRTARLAPSVSAGLDTVGIRMPAHPAARAVIAAAGLPLAAPSANLSGSPSPTTAQHVLADMKGRIPLILDGGNSPVGVESTVITLVGTPTVLRPGFVTANEIAEVLGGPVAVAAAVTAPLAAGQAPASPGMKYKHYAPKAEITILQGNLAQFSHYVAAKATGGVWALCFEGEETEIPVPCVTYGKKNNPATQATALFSALRTLDEKGAKTVFARAPGTSGVGFAVYNRLLRAAAFRVLEL